MKRPLDARRDRRELQDAGFTEDELAAVSNDMLFYASLLQAGEVTRGSDIGPVGGGLIQWTDSKVSALRRVAGLDG